MSTRNRFRGWSLIEVTIILLVLSILSAILAPAIGRFVRNARVVRARKDVKVLGVAIWMYSEDTANSAFFVNGNASGQWQANATGPYLHPDNIVSMLVTDGDIPQARPGAGQAERAPWQRPVSLAGRVDFLENHIVANQPFGAPASAYRTALHLDNADNTFSSDTSAGFNSKFAWRGPYMTAPLPPDPWGNRYAVNVEYLDPGAYSVGPGAHVHGTAGWAHDVVVLSAGPDGEIDTPFSANALGPGDDDILYTLSANSRP